MHVHADQIIKCVFNYSLSFHPNTRNKKENTMTVIHPAVINILYVFAIDKNMNIKLHYFIDEINNVFC